MFHIFMYDEKECYHFVLNVIANIICKLLHQIAHRSMMRPQTGIPCA